MEKAVSLKELSDMSGWPYESLLAATKRARTRHPLPCIKRGDKRPRRYVRPSDFEKWEREETCT